MNKPIVASRIKVLSWNIDGHISLKLSCPTFLNIIKSNHIVLMQETHLTPGHHRTLAVPQSYQMFCISRKYKEAYCRPFGGVVAFVRDGIHVTFHENLSSPNVMILETSAFLIIHAYILPEGSRWEGFTDNHPYQKLTEVLSLLVTMNKPLLLMGDLNARTECLSPLQNLLRESLNRKAPSMRGKALVQLCADLELAIANGLPNLGEKNGGYTSFQALGSAVVDYLIINMA